MPYTSFFGGTIEPLGFRQAQIGSAGVYDVIVRIDPLVGYGQRPLLDIRGFEVLNLLIPGTPTANAVTCHWDRQWDQISRRVITFTNLAQVNIMRVDTTDIQDMRVDAWYQKR